MLRRWTIRRPVVLGASSRPHRRGRTLRFFRWAALAAAGLMIATAAISYSNNKLRRCKTYVVLAELTDVVYRFQHDFQRFPDSLEQILRPPAGQRPYAEKIPKDAWGKPFRYEVMIESGSGSFRIVSDGPDGEPDTRDDIENL